MSLISAEHPVLVVGAGKMGGALLSGWLKQGRPGNHFIIVDPGLNEHARSEFSALGLSHHEALPENLSPSVVLLAIKPQMMDAVLPNLAVLAKSDPLFISVAAGTAVSTFRSAFGASARIVRAMPNTPAQVGRGVTVAFATDNVSSEQKAEVETLLSVTGEFDWVAEETLIDAVTAVSGSGPAYVFYLVEALAKAAEDVGLDRNLSWKLARKTVEGAGELLHQSDEEASTLRQNVTSPGGTTAAALGVLMADDGLTPLMKKAVNAAEQRAKELAQES